MRCNEIVCEVFVRVKNHQHNYSNEKIIIPHHLEFWIFYLRSNGDN